MEGEPYTIEIERRSFLARIYVKSKECKKNEKSELNIGMSVKLYWNIEYTFVKVTCTENHSILFTHI